MAGSDERIEEESIRRKREDGRRGERMGNMEGSLVGREPPTTLTSTGAGK